MFTHRIKAKIVRIWIFNIEYECLIFGEIWAFVSNKTAHACMIAFVIW